MNVFQPIADEAAVVRKDHGDYAAKAFEVTCRMVITLDALAMAMRSSNATHDQFSMLCVIEGCCDTLMYQMIENIKNGDARADVEQRIVRTLKQVIAAAKREENAKF